jgi:lysophospholipase L1-like esterase
MFTNHRPILRLMLLLPLLAGCGGSDDARNDWAEEAQPTAPTVAPGRWVVMGSSTAAGVGASPGQGWAAQLGSAVAARQVTLHSLARAGALTYEALPAGSPPAAQRPAPDPSINTDRALGLAPRLVILSFPSNDTATGYGADETVGNLLAMRRALQAGSSAVLVLSTLPRDGLDPAQRATLAEVDRRLAAALGACFADVRSALDDGHGRIATAFAAGDGVHLNDAGHRLLYERVRAALDGGRCVRAVGV